MAGAQEVVGLERAELVDGGQEHRPITGELSRKRARHLRTQERACLAELRGDDVATMFDEPRGPGRRGDRLVQTDAGGDEALDLGRRWCVGVDVDLEQTAMRLDVPFDRGPVEIVDVVEVAEQRTREMPARSAISAVLGW